jgi:hypothetical protein
MTGKCIHLFSTHALFSTRNPVRSLSHGFQIKWTARVVISAMETKGKYVLRGSHPAAAVYIAAAL